MSPIASDIKLETESDFSSDEDFPSRVDLRYQPKLALKQAMSEWILEIRSAREPPRQPFPRVIPTFLPPGVPSGPPGVPQCLPPGPPTPLMLTPSPPPSSPPGVPSSAPGNPPIPPGINPFPTVDPPTPQEIPSAAQPCMDPAALSSHSPPAGVSYMPPSPPAGLPLPDVIKTCLTPSSTSSSVISSCGVTPLPLIMTSAQPPEPIPTYLQPPSLPVNSLSEILPSDTDSITDSTSAPEFGAEPMDVASDAAETIDEPIPKLEKQNSSDSLMQVEGSDNDRRPDNNDSVDTSGFTEDDALLLAELFYMPFEHGSHGIFLLQRLHWLRTNVLCIVKNGTKDVSSFEVHLVLLFSNSFQFDCFFIFLSIYRPFKHIIVESSRIQNCLMSMWRMVL